MQRLREIARRVEAVYNDIDHSFADYQRQSGLTCQNGCGACCNNPQIEATELEMLPLALFLFDSGQAETVLEQVQHQNSFYCTHFIRHSLDGRQGQCSTYQHRPTICRVFGAAAVSGKHQRRLSVCAEIKTSVPDKYAAALISMESDRVPYIPDAKSQVMGVDFQLGQQHYPINQALALVLERVLREAWYSQDLSDGQVA